MRIFISNFSSQKFVILVIYERTQYNQDKSLNIFWISGVCVIPWYSLRVEWIFFKTTTDSWMRQSFEMVAEILQDVWSRVSRVKKMYHQRRKVGSWKNSRGLNSVKMGVDNYWMIRMVSSQSLFLKLPSELTSEIFMQNYCRVKETNSLTV